MPTLLDTGPLILAVALGLGGDCLDDIAVLRAEPGVFGLMASDPTVSARLRTVDFLRMVQAQINRFFASDGRTWRQK